MKRCMGLVLAAFIGLVTFGANSAGATFPGSNGRLAFWDSAKTPWQIASMNPDGTGRMVLTSNRRRFSSGPAWSADGLSLAYITSGRGLDRLVTMNADGTGRQLILERLPRRPCVGA